MKNKVIASILGIFLLKSVSAYGSYGFSLGSFLDSVDSSTLILGTLFLIFFAIINFSLGRVFKDKYGNPNKTIAGVVSFGVSLLIIYGLNKTGMDFEGLFLDIGFSGDLLFTIVPIIFLIAILMLLWKFKTKTLLVLGILLIVVSFTDYIYEKGTLIGIGFGFLILYALIWFFTRKKKPKIGGGFPIQWGRTPRGESGMG